ncbi:MAG: hypothetical protein ACHQCF_00870 [Solirubrobacterales bacterium]
MRAPPALLCALALTAAVAACGQRGEGSTPVACLSGEKAYLKALEDAPAGVELNGGIRISECLVENQTAGDLASVGEAMVAATTKLNAEARAEPGGDANLQLGYLLGAGQRAAEGNEGIDAELIRRLTASASYSPDNRPLPRKFTRTYREGFDAGHSGG